MRSILFLFLNVVMFLNQQALGATSQQFGGTYWSCQVTAASKIYYGEGYSQSDAINAAHLGCKRKFNGLNCSKPSCTPTALSASTWTCQSRAKDQIFFGSGPSRKQAEAVAQNKCKTQYNGVFCSPKLCGTI